MRELVQRISSELRRIENFIQRLFKNVFWDGCGGTGFCRDFLDIYQFCDTGRDLLWTYMDFRVNRIRDTILKTYFNACIFYKNKVNK